MTVGLNVYSGDVGGSMEFKSCSPLDSDIARDIQFCLSKRGIKQSLSEILLNWPRRQSRCAVSVATVYYFFGFMMRISTLYSQVYGRSAHLQQVLQGPKLALFEGQEVFLGKVERRGLRSRHDRAVVLGATM